MRPCDAHRVTYTLVSFHAHPDDEVLLTGGTLARAAAEGHRVVLAVATNGEAGAAAGDYRADGLLGERREAELERSAAALGCARLVRFGFADSGWESPREHGFSRLPVAEAAAPLADLLREERADALTVYDPAGGYGHPDHRHVHTAGIHAAELAGTPLVLEATIDRALIRRLVRLVEAVPWLRPDLHSVDYDAVYTASADITHRIDVRAYADAKRRAMQAHASQASSEGDTARTLALLLKMPPWLFRQVLGREWFVERGRPAAGRSDDLFASLRPAPPGRQ